MSPRPTKSANNLLKLSSQWEGLPLGIQIEIAVVVALKVFRKMPQFKKVLLRTLAACGLAAVIILTVHGVRGLDSTAIVWGAWMFLLGALLVMIGVWINNRR